METSSSLGAGMRAWSCAIGAVALTVLLPATGLAAADPGDAAACQTVEAPMFDVAAADDEPRLRVPIPQGWEQPPVSDPAEASIRLAILNPALSAEGFTPNAVIALRKIAPRDAQRVLDAQNEVLVAKAGATDLKTRYNEVCGLPAMTSTYTAPATGEVPPRSAATRVVVYPTDDATYVATVTVQAVDPGAGSYAQDAQIILDGFQVLAAG